MLELYKDLKMTEYAREAAIKRENSRIIKETTMKNLYYSMKKYIEDDTDKIKNSITDEMAKPKKERSNKVVFFANNTLDPKDYKSVFETCFNDELDDPLIDILKQKFPYPYYKVYRKTLYGDDYYDRNGLPHYVIFIKWNKKKLGVK